MDNDIVMSQHLVDKILFLDIIITANADLNLIFLSYDSKNIKMAPVMKNNRKRFSASEALRMINDKRYGLDIKCFC